MTVGGCGMLMSGLAMLQSRRGVLLGLLMLADSMVMGRLIMMMRGRVMVSGRLKVVLSRWMLRCLCHLQRSSYFLVLGMLLSATSLGIRFNAIPDVKRLYPIMRQAN